MWAALKLGAGAGEERCAAQDRHEHHRDRDPRAPVCGSPVDGADVGDDRRSPVDGSREHVTGQVEAVGDGGGITDGGRCEGEGDGDEEQEPRSNETASRH